MDNMTVEQTCFEDWPAGASEPVALINITTDFISRRLKVDFRQGHDNVDNFEACVFQTRMGTAVVFQKYDNAPGPGVNLFVQQDAPQALREIAQDLALTRDEVLWAASWAKPMLDSATRAPTHSRKEVGYKRRSLSRREKPRSLRKGLGARH
jgi:hypothetical protein